MKIKVQGEKLTVNYEVLGEGADVVLVHGLGLSSMETWTCQRPVLSKHFRLHLYDLRGFGGTDNPSGRFSVQQHAYDLYELLRCVNVTKVFLVGFSLGGRIALKFALDHPEMTRGLVLSSTASSMGSEGIVRYLQRADRVEKYGMEAIAEEQIQGVFTAETIAKRPDLITWYHEQHLKNDPKSYAEMFRALTTVNFTPLLGRVDCPTLITCGKKERVIYVEKGPTETAEILNRGIPKSKLIIIPDASHYAQLEKPDTYNKIVMDFIQGVLDRT